MSEDPPLSAAPDVRVGVNVIDPVHFLGLLHHGGMSRFTTTGPWPLRFIPGVWSALVSSSPSFTTRTPWYFHFDPASPSTHSPVAEPEQQELLSH